MSKEDINKLIGARIKAARKDQGLTLLELASKVGLSEGNVQRYESGNIANVSISVLIKFARALTIKPEELLGWESAPATLAPDEEELVTKYRQLSPEGKSTIRDMVDYQLFKEIAQKDAENVGIA